jgi:anti-sigma-K factor RskA
MSTNYPNNQPHPEELLDAYVLDALEEEEEIQVEAHLENCAQCRQAVSELQRAAAQLGLSVAHREPPGTLLLRLMDSLEPVAATARPAKDATSSIWSRTRTVKLLVPIAAAVVVAVLALSVVMNFRNFDRTENLERENSTLTAQMAQSVNEESRVAQTVQELRMTNYWLANPTNRSFALEPPSGAGDSRGVLLVSSDGRRAMLLLVDMRAHSQSATYQVWLMRHGDRLWAGEVKVDDRGWGAVTLRPQESVFRYDKVELTAEKVPGASSTPSDMVLEGEITEEKPSQKLTLEQWR